MFAVLPLIIFVIAVIGLLLLVGRKFPYLRKLEPEILKKSHQHKGIVAEFFPELAERLSSEARHKSWVDMLSVYERILTALRDVWKQLEKWTQSLVETVHSKNKESKQLLKDVQQEKEVEVQQLQMQQQAASEAQEQQLILAIAKDPKNAQLYVQLGKLYTTLQQWEDARDSLQKAIELGSQEPGIQEKLDKVLKNLTIE